MLLLVMSPAFRRSPHSQENIHEDPAPEHHAGGLGRGPLCYAADNASDSNKARSSNPAQIDTAHGAAMKSCDTLPAGRDKNVCNAEKDAQANIAKAEQGVNTRNDEASRQELRRVRADSEFNIAKAKCDNEPGCLKNAQSNYDKAQAQIKSGVAPTVVQ